MRASPTGRWAARAAVVGVLAVLALTGGSAAVADAETVSADAGATWAAPLGPDDGATWATVPAVAFRALSGATWA